MSLLNVLFFDSYTFLKREVLGALRRRADIRLTAAAIPEHPGSGNADAVFEQLRPLLPALVVSLNEAGFDYEGRLFDRIAATGSHFVNWFYDDPRYEYLFAGRRPSPSARRLDFVWEVSLLDDVRAMGYDARFLPLAVDPAFFNRDAGPLPVERDVAFVGNSSLEFLDSIVTPQLSADMERHAPLLAEMRAKYGADPQLSLWEAMTAQGDRWRPDIASDERRFLFAMEWMVGYLHRKDFIVGLAREFGDRFTCFGDGGWSQFLPAAQLSPNACYYDNLCRYYRTTAVNINVNRIQTRTSFTQRIFDCKASGAFLLTERREMNGRYFRTAGPDPELVEYASLDECKKLVRRYLADPAARERIALAGRERVLAEHTYDARLGTIFEECGKKWGW